jgi:serine/threonine-protein phosphatase 2A regulatory subunit A
MPKPEVIADGLPIYKRLAVDDQDSVRLLTVEDLIIIARHLSPAEIESHLLMHLRQSVTDKSWRVRYMVASNFVEVSNHLLLSYAFS